MTLLSRLLTALFAFGLLVLAPTRSHADCPDASRVDLDTVNWSDLRERVYAENRPDNIGYVDAYIRSVFKAGRVTEYEKATTLYTELLVAPVEGKARRIQACHRAQLRLITPDSMLAGNPSADEWAQRAAEWLRAQDPIPSTAASERTVEHLRRVSIAEKEFADDRQPSGVDVRGDTFIRLGPPANVTSIQFNSSRVLTIIRENPILTRGDFPENQYWVYPSLSEYAEYIFYRDGKTWSLGTVLDLIPASFRAGMGTNPRGQRRAGELSILLQEIYAQFSTINIDYATLYQESADVAAVTLSGSRTSDIRRLVSRGRTYDQDRAYRREQEVPKQVAQQRSEKQFPVDVHPTRFLTEDGKTRVEINWGLLPSTVAELVPSALRFAAVQYDGRYRRDTMRTNEYTLSRGLLDNPDATIIAPPLSAVFGDDNVQHFALQWDQYAQGTGGMGTARRSVYRLDSLRALSNDASTLEMSDLQVTFVPPSPQTASLDDLQVNPFRYLGPDQGFGVYFEVYNLLFGDEDKTDYRVEYTFRKRTEDGGWIRLRDGEDVLTTGTGAVYSGDARRTREFVVVEPEQLSGVDGTRQLEFLVRVTDLTSSATVQRSVRFDYVSEGGNS